MKPLKAPVTPQLKMGALVLLLFAVSSLLLLAESKTFYGDTQFLKQLKNSLDRNSVTQGSCISSWDFILDPCDSLFSDHFTCGFRCDLTDDSGLSRVTEIGLDQAGYSGSDLSSLSWNLPYLETVDLSGNYFSGSLPESFSNLTRLRRLSLSGNSFYGSIPSSLGSLAHLEELFLDNNNLQGSIPLSFNNLYSLNRLEIQANKLTGELPKLDSLSNLYYLDVSNNLITGQLPSTFPSSLIQISMRNNSIVGTVPEAFKDLGSLQVLDLSHNKLNDSVPSYLFSHPSLQQLTLSHNLFSSVQNQTTTPGTILQSQLIAIDLSNNKLQGFLPSFMALMPKLSALSLENNMFTGMIPTQYAFKVAVPGAGISPFARLLLGGNYLFGPLPGPWLSMKPGSANVGLGNNCLYRCPRVFFFCQGGDQKSMSECRSFVPVIP